VIKVYYSGVWDLLHVGHIHALRRAAALGDHLTVGVITDEFAKSYKAMPIVPYRERVFIISQLRFVNEVIPSRWWDDNLAYCLENGITVRAVGRQFGEQHPLQRKIRAKMERLGIKYVDIPWGPDISTTLIKERIVRREKEKIVNSACGCS
jgi:glycerol-3-phosphate cytidylyltransferase